MARERCALRRRLSADRDRRRCDYGCHVTLPWFQLDPEEISALPVDELALRILVQLGAGAETRTTLVSRMQAVEPAPREAKQAVVEAWWWLIRKGLIAPNSENADDSLWTPTRLGLDVASRPDGLARLRAGERVEMDLHPRIAADVRAEFLRGKFETAVWVAMRAVEVALREASGADAHSYGNGLLAHAFANESGTLIDYELPDAERQAVAYLFRGAIGALKNPHSHREIRIEDSTEAAEIVVFASLLLRILDRLAEQRGVRRTVSS